MYLGMRVKKTLFSIKEKKNKKKKKKKTYATTKSCAYITFRFHRSA